MGHRETDRRIIASGCRVGEKMDVAAFAEHVRSLPFGKRLPQATYVYAPDSTALPDELRAIVDRLRAQMNLAADFNVLKFADEGGISFLRYLRFFETPHPELSESVRVSLVTGKVTRSRFGSDGNPPILHRKELLVAPGEALADSWARLTAQEEAAGLYEFPATIGFKAVWEKLLSEKRLAYRDHDLVERESGASVELLSAAPKIFRHRTALTRSGVSKPIRLALDSGLIKQGTTVFDYGCGHGTDVRILRDMGYAVGAWDPAFFPHDEKAAADVVNLGFVLNVIEDPGERLEVLREAWSLANQALIVSTLVQGQEGHTHGELHGDGVITSRRTFQKYFEQGELQGLLEAALDAEPHALSLGVFVVFKEPRLSQSFVEGRLRRSIDWDAIRSRFVSRRSAKRSRIAILYESHGELLDAFWARSLELGRLPKTGEFPRETELRHAAGAPATVLRLLVTHLGGDALDEAAQRRKEDLLVYLALAAFRKRIPQKHLAPQLQTDLTTFFGSYARARAEGLELLMSLGAEELLWDAAVALPFGWRDPVERHLVIHSSLLDQLPPALRVFIECGAILYGDPQQADLIKLHLGTRKVTFLVYEDFFRKAFPELRTRIKVDLARLHVTVFEYGFALPAQLLFYKERFVAADHRLRPRMEQISRRLSKLGVLKEGLGPNDENALGKAVFMQRLDELGLRDDLTRRRQSRGATAATESDPPRPANQRPASGGTS